MIKLYTTVIPDYGGILFYAAEICFSSRTHSTDYLHEAILREKSNQKKKKTKKKTISAFNQKVNILHAIF